MAPSSSSGRRYKYDVFLNFRGEDTRKIFVCHLHHALVQRGLKTYMDAEDLQKGKDILEAISDSKLSIIVFSQNYASSSWCLQELVQILKCMDTRKQIVVTVVYLVDPSEVRKMKRCFAQAFAKHESDSNADMEEVQSWRSALTKAINLSGWDSRYYKGWDSRDYKDDAKLIDDIVEDVVEKLDHIPSGKNNHLVGMDSHIPKMRQLLCLEMDDVRKVGIWGMSGIGKTTIAAAVYDEISYQFDHYFFLDKVREGFMRKGEVLMQEKLLSGLLKKQVQGLDTLNEGYKIMERLSKKKVLVVLDDVDNSTQIETLLGNEPSFGGGSRIIVTTRDNHILNGFERYKAELLSDGDARKLFNHYAFKTNKPPGEYDHLSRRVAEYAQGLPLALKVLGALLNNRSVSEWEDELEKINKIPNSKIQKVLRTSFDGLDELQKNIFLDIACFFRGMSKEYVTKVLDSCGFFPHIGLKVLVDRALVTISNSDELEMHDLLQEMGWEIESTKDLGKRSRLWRYKDFDRVLTQNTATEAVEVLMVELPNSEDMYLNAEAFVNMTKLRMLMITCLQRYNPDDCKNHFIGDLKFLSHELRYLVWHRYPLKSLPSNFDPKNLVDLDMRYSHIEQLWQGIKPLKKLIRMNLSYSQYLNNIPDLTEATNLEKLHLEGCTSLLQVNESISDLTNLVFLSLQGCRELKSLPNSIHMKSLKILVLSGCSKLDKFPEISETMEALSELNLDGTAIEELPSSIERLQRLESLSMKNCTSLVCLPDSICNLADLRYLYLSGCSKLDNLPENLGNLESLWELEIQGSGIKELPVSIVRLNRGGLSFYGCKAEQKQIVMPFFYPVDPSHARKQEESFTQSIAKHESNKDLQKLQTSTEAANLSGWNYREYKEDAELIKHIVEDVSEKQIRISPCKANDNLVGMDSHLQKMRLRLCLLIDDVRVVGIWGMSGIGKTTVARAVYDEIVDQFDHSCFLGNVKEGFGNQVRMQEQLLSGILKKEVRIDSLNDGYKMMGRLSGKRVLVVLDDVANSNQIKILVGPEPSFGAGSRIIVTTWDSHVVSEFERYEVSSLSDCDAHKLFCQHAFKINKPSEEYDNLSRHAVVYAQGVPLALKILGSHLVGRSVSEWKEELDKIKKFPNTGIQKVFRTSFDGLDDSQKKLFLDIACFFKGMHKDYVTKVLGSCDGFYPHTGLKVLVEKALVTISKFGRLEMHDLPQEIGRGIVQSEKPWKHSRLWNYEDVQNVLTQNKAMKVEGIMVELSNSGDICLDAEAVASMTNLRLLRITYPQYSNQFDEFLRFEGGRWPKQYLRQPENCRQQLNGDPKFLSHKLMVLAWHGCPLKSLPFNFDPKNLVDLDMRYSLIEQLWQGTKSVKELISINLSYCRDLNKIPVCTEAPKLEKLFLEDCRSLLEVDQSISALKNLVFLSLKGCTELKILPSSIHLMKSLKILNLCGCSNLEMFPEILEDMEALLKLELGYSGIRELPSSIERLRRLESLNMIHCRSLVSLPDSICNLAELRYLNLTWCSKLCNLPENLGNLQSLRVLEAREIGIKQLPVSILRLNLGRLKLNGSKQMEAPLSSWPSSIEDCCTVVVHIDLSYCNLLELSDAIAYFPSLKILRLSRNNLESLPAIMNRLVFLEQLELDGCKRLKSIPELSSSISYINGHDCTALETVSTPKRPYDMGRCFTFSNCSQLVQEDIFRDIVETHSPPQGNYSRPFYMSFPGSEMPGWFRHQCRGSSVTAQLPPNWFDNKFLGFAICAVTNTPQGFGTHYKLTAQCFCTFRGNRCEYRFSFYLFDGLFFIKNSLESNHMLMGYVPWSEFGINGGEEVNERRYTEATFEVLNDKGHFGGIKCCGVRFFFANNEEVSYQDFGEPMVHYERSLEGCSAEPITNDEDEQYLKLSELFDGANRNSREYDSESDCEIEDNDSSGKRKILSRWTQEVRVASGLKQGHQDDGFSWMWYSQGYQDEEMQYIRSKHRCIHKPSCSAKSKVRTSIDDPTILEITYIGRHTCWKTLPMLTHQVRVALGMAPEGPFDGFSWGKYGQMDILGAKYPRVCYVCIPPNVRGCMAIKEVQLCDDDQKILKITYRGRHTCIQASTVSIGGWCDDRIFEGGGALRIHGRLEEDDPIDFEEALDFNGLMERTREVMESGDDQPNESNSISNNNP